MHSSITIIVGTSVTEKVGNQNVLYFLTSPNLCFCTTFENRKPCFHINAAHAFYQNHTKHIKISPGYS